MKHVIVVFLLSVAACAQAPVLLDRPTIAALANELSGASAKRTVEYIALHHRSRGSRPLRAVAEHISAELRSYGLADVHIEQLPADGKLFYGTQRSRPGWDADFAELWLLSSHDGQWTPEERLGSWDAVPMTLAEDSESGDVEAELVDVGAGTSDKDYEGKDVRGKVVLASAQADAVQRVGVAKYEAAAIVSYAQNQPTAWSGENDNQIRWGHLGTFSANKTFAFMISLRQARVLQKRLAAGEHLRVHGTVRAGQHASTYDIVMGAIPGSDPVLREQEIVYTCHLDHPRPGANDNASGCATILEIARSLAKLVREKKLPPPRRTLRFVWPMEVEGSLALLNARPQWAQRVKANIHLDMVGGGPETKAVFHVTRSPASLPTFINDVAESIAAFVNEQTYKFAATGTADFPLAAQAGGREPLRADFARFTMGSDHEVFADSSWGIPSIYLNDWPDRNIHTTYDTPAAIDTTKLKRAAFIAAASGYVLAMLDDTQAGAVVDTIRERSLARASDTLRRITAVPVMEQANTSRFELAFERGGVNSIARFMTISAETRTRADQFLASLAHVLPAAGNGGNPQGDGTPVFRRKATPKGPLSVFGYDYLEDHYGRERTRALRLLNYEGLWGSGGEYAYEVLNLADGHRTVQQIRDYVSATYGPVPLADIAEYLRALEAAGILEQVGH